MIIDTFTSAKEYLFSRIQFGMKSGLDNITQLCDQLDNPQDSLKCIHIGGTNGKGSTSLYTQSVISAHGYRVGLFTSPHLISVRERLRIGSEVISEEAFTVLTQKVAAASHDIEATFFETITAMAFCYFQEQNVDYAVIEVGLGGRLDSTNICKSICTATTSIALDHTAILGTTLEEITKEKLGIIKPSVPHIAFLKQESLQSIAHDQCLSNSAPLTLCNRAMIDSTQGTTSLSLNQNRVTDVSLKNPGMHYQENALVALSICETVLQNFSTTTARRAISSAQWPARMHSIAQESKPTFILDGAHNPAGSTALVKSLTQLYPNKKFTFILSALEDKDFSAIAQLIEPLAHTIILTQSSHAKSSPPEILKHSFTQPCTLCTTIPEALHHCTTLTEPIIVTGSLYFMGDLIELLKEEYDDLAWFRNLSPDSNEVK